MATYQFPGTDYHDLNLDWLLNQMKQLISDMDDLKTDYTAYKAQIDAKVNELEQVITTYLASFDARLPAEVESLFNAYKTSDEFANFLIQQLTEDSTGEGSILTDAVAEWLHTHITQETGYVIDDTLTVSGAAADAKSAGDEISNLKTQLNEINKSVNYITNKKIYYPSIRKLRSLSGKIVENNNFRSVIIPVITGRHYKIETIGKGNRNLVYGITSETWDIGTDALNLEYTPEVTTPTDNITIEIDPTGYTFLLVTLAYSTETPYPYDSFTVKVTESETGQFLVNGIPTITVEQLNERIGSVTKEATTEGKYVSILGDSISALAGTIPSGNEAYYTGNNYGIASANDMWWKIVADKLGMNVLINNSWSGSQVCDRTPGTIIPASYPARCQALHDENHDPDYVLIAMGVNDYSYNSYIGDWNGQTMPIDDTDFTQSYALMINRIKSAYNNVKIICIAPWFVQRGTDTGVVYVNSQSAHLTESAYGDVIRKLCNIMGAIYVDSDVGFNRYNYYPTYCQDNEDHPTHPNKAGQAVIGNVISEKIRMLIY